MSHIKMYIKLGEEDVEVRMCDDSRINDAINSLNYSSDNKNWTCSRSIEMENIEVNHKTLAYASACLKLRMLSSILKKNSVYLHGSRSTAVIDPISGSDFPSPYSAIVEIEKWKMENGVKMKTTGGVISLQFTEEENVTAFFEKEITREKIEVAIICVPVR